MTMTRTTQYAHVRSNEVFDFSWRIDAHSGTSETDCEVIQRGRGQRKFRGLVEGCSKSLDIPCSGQEF